MKKFIIITILFILGNCLWAAPLKKVTLQLKWQNQFQFAGYYAALEKGYYKQAGFDVTIRELKAGENPIKEVLDGRADYGISGSGLVTCRPNGKSIVTLGVIVQHSPLALAVLKTSNIKFAGDLAGKTIMVPEFEAEILAYLKRTLFNLDSGKIINKSASIFDLINKKADAISIYETQEPYELNALGYENLIFSPRSIGLDFYGDCLFTSESLVKSNIDEVKAFKEASIKGWNFALKNPDEMINILINKYGVKRSPNHLRFEYENLKALISENQTPIGYMSTARWSYILDLYKELGLCPQNANLEGFLLDDYLKPDYEKFYLLLLVLVISLFVFFFIIIRFKKYNTKLKLEIIQKEKAQEEVSRSEKKYRFLIENMNEVICEVNNGFTLQFISPAVYKFLGYRPEELIGKKFVDYLVKESQEYVFEIHKTDTENAIKGIKRTFKQVELNLIRKDGEKVWAEASFSPIYDSTGNYIGYHGLTRDITKRKLLEISINKNQAFLNAIIENAPDNIFVVETYGDDKYRIVETNEGLCKLLNIPREKIIGMELSAIISNHYLNRITSNYKKALNSDTPITFEETYTIRETDYFFETKLSKINILGVIYLIGISRNITQRVKLENDLKENEEAFQKIIEYMPFPLVVTNIKNQSVYKANSKSYDLFGVPYNLSQELYVNEFYYDINDRTNLFKLVKEKSFVNDLELRFKNAQGKDFWAIFSSVLVTINEEELLITGLNDVTARKKEEQALIAANKELEAANKAKSEFISHISHEIRTPLNAILGFAELMKNKIHDEALNEYLKGIESGGSSLLHLLNDILDLSKLEFGVIEIRNNPTDLISLAKDIKNIFSYEANKKGLELKIEIASGLPHNLMLDEPRLRQTLLNLVGNAVKYTNSGGVTLSLDYVPTDNNTLDLVIKIIDTGIGIDIAEQTKIFDAFYQSKNQSVNIGAGLGLAISKRLIELMGGSIFLESYVGKGTTFIIEFFDTEILTGINDILSDSKENVPIDVDESTSLSIENGNLTKLDIDLDAQVLNEFVEKFEIRITNMISGFSMDEISLLARDLIDFGTDKQELAIIEFGKVLLKIALTFDFYIIKDKLSELKDIIGILKRKHNVD